ncbi:MAG: ATP-binding protein [Bryobacteraceae bacterium]|nr:ATP-binding protein [Bryobacteraceae bacterium]
MKSLRARLVVVFLAATLVPLGVTLWITARLLDLSLRYSTTFELDRLSRSLERTGRELYQRERESLRAEVSAGRQKSARFDAADRGSWPPAVVSFWESGAEDRFRLADPEGRTLSYLVRDRDGSVLEYSRELGVGLTALGNEYRQARVLVNSERTRDLRRGFFWTVAVLAGLVWVAAFAALVWQADRISRPIAHLTSGLSALAAGKLDTRLKRGGGDEVGRATNAFNEMAGQLEKSRDRLVYLAQLSSWQALARKMAHEVKNSLTPIRLNVEEIVARRNDHDGAFIEQAAQIVIDEVNSLERRVRAFSDFAAEPPLQLRPLDLNALLEERVAFLRRGHPDVWYEFRLEADLPRPVVDEDLLRGILTNLLENAAQAAGEGGTVFVRSAMADGMLLAEVQDSGPGLSAHARETLFEPTISFKRGGMGLGLSIARKSALLLGGDLALVQGSLGGAAFQLRLPAPPQRAGQAVA